MFLELKNLLMLIFFSKTILLTPQPVTISNIPIEIAPKKQFTAITPGAALQVDISNITKEKDFEKLRTMFPVGTVEAVIVTSEGNKIRLRDGHFAYSTDSICIILSNDPIPINSKYTKVIISSKIQLNNVKMYWKNFKH